MASRKLLLVFLLTFVTAAAAYCAPGYRVEIDLEQQMAYLLRGRSLVLASPISSGRAGHLTSPGSFKIAEKERNHFSSLYGQIVDARGNVVVRDADADMAVPPGGKFLPAPMRYFMRFNGAIGMHAGYLPGYPASHGCVRMPEENAIVFFNAVDSGTPVHVFGRTPLQRDYLRYGPQPREPRPQLQYRPRFDPRAGEPIYDPREIRSGGW